MTTPPSEVSALLAPGEKILWAAQPRPYVFMLRGLPNIAYGVTWSVLGAFWFRGAGGVGKYSAFEGWWKLTPLFSFPFILAGFSFFLYPIRLGARARRTWYVVTDRRVFLAELSPRRPAKIVEFGPDNLAALRVVPRLGRLCDITLSRRVQENPQLQPPLESGFFGIEEGGKVAEEIGAVAGQTPR
jgi:hypothetical protein